MSSTRPAASSARSAGPRGVRLPAGRWFAGLLVILATLVVVVIVDVVLLALAGTSLGERGAAILAAIVGTLCVAPFHERLTGALHRLLTGRTDTFEVMSTLADRLGNAEDEGGRLDDLVAVVAEGFSAHYVEARLLRRDGSVSVARRGEPKAEPLRVPLDYRNASFGELLLEPGRRLTRRDSVLLTDLVRLAAAAIATADTSDELQRIRTRLVLAREDERQRLRGDLHDHLVPLLDTLSARAADSRDALRSSTPAESRAHLQAAVRVASFAVDDIRRVAQDLRPPALDDLGLGKALDQLAARYAGRVPELALTWRLPGERPAAVEVAVYRIVADALDALARRPGIGPVAIAVGTDGGVLRVEVRVAGRVELAGHGTADFDAQRERAEELGGSWAVDEDGGATVITAVLPVTEEVSGVR